MKKKDVKSEKPKNDIQYYRVSSNEQVLGFSLDNQEKFCRELSTKEGYAVLKTWREEGESAKTADRTQLQLMMRYCEQNKKQIARLVVYKVDRLSRNTADYLALKAFFNRLGIIVVSATEKLEDTPGGKFYETLLSAAAEFDNNVRSQRTIEGMKARLMRGLWSGIAPWGYINTKDTLGNKLIAPHPERAPIVKMIFELWVTRKYSHEEIAKIARKGGQKSRHGMKISKQLVAKIIRNPIYCGKVVVPKFEISTQGSHITIISEKLFEQANSDKKDVEGGKPLRNRDSPDFPLRGIICGGCGKSISGGKTKGKTKYYQYYGCFNGECKSRHAIKKIDLEDDFTKLLVELTPNDDYFEILREAIRLAHKNELTSVEATERRLNTKMEELKSGKEELLNLRIKGTISDDDFIPANENFKYKISELEKEIASLSTPELGVENVIESGIEFLKQLPKDWNNPDVLDVKDLRVLRSLLFPFGLNYHYPGIKTPKVCCIYNIKSEFLHQKNHQVTLRRIELRFQP